MARDTNGSPPLKRFRLAQSTNLNSNSTTSPSAHFAQSSSTATQSRPSRGGFAGWGSGRADSPTVARSQSQLHSESQSHSPGFRSLGFLKWLSFAFWKGARRHASSDTTSPVSRSANQPPFRWSSIDNAAVVDHSVHSLYSYSSDSTYSNSKLRQAPVASRVAILCRFAVCLLVYPIVCPCKMTRRSCSRMTTNKKWLLLGVTLLFSLIYYFCFHSSMISNNII